MKCKIYGLLLFMFLFFSCSISTEASGEKIDEKMIQMIANNDSNVMEVYDDIISIDTIKLNESSKEQIVQAHYSNSNGI